MSATVMAKVCSDDSAFCPVFEKVYETHDADEGPDVTDQEFVNNMIVQLFTSGKGELKDRLETLTLILNPPKHNEHDNLVPDTEAMNIAFTDGVSSILEQPLMENEEDAFELAEFTKLEPAKSKWYANQIHMLGKLLAAKIKPSQIALLNAIEQCLKQFAALDAIKNPKRKRHEQPKEVISFVETRLTKLTTMLLENKHIELDKVSKDAIKKFITDSEISVPEDIKKILD